MAYDDNHFASVKEEVLRHLEDTETSKLAHWDAAAVYERRHKLFIGLAATLLSLLLTWMLSSDVKAFFATGGAFNAVANNTPVILSLVVSVLSGLGAFLNFQELASKHRAAAENLNALLARLQELEHRLSGCQLVREGRSNSTGLSTAPQ